MDRNVELTGFPYEIHIFLNALIAVQKELAEVQPQKKEALLRRDFDQASSVQQRERQLHRQLLQVLQQRKHLIENLQRSGVPGETLFQQAVSQNWHRLEPLNEQFTEARKLGLEVREQSWALWSFAHRASRYYGSALELIAQGGRRQPTYQQDESQSAATGGTLFDASI